MLMFAKVCIEFIEVTAIMFSVMQTNNELPSCEDTVQVCYLSVNGTMSVNGIMCHNGATKP